MGGITQRDLWTFIILMIGTLFVLGLAFRAGNRLFQKDAQAQQAEQVRVWTDGITTPLTLTTAQGAQRFTVQGKEALCLEAFPFNYPANAGIRWIYPDGSALNGSGVSRIGVQGIDARPLPDFMTPPELADVLSGSCTQSTRTVTLKALP